jgi:hypothetical protein
MRPASLAALLILSCAADPAEQEPPPGFDLLGASFKPQFRIEASSNAALDAFVAARAGDDVNSLWLSDVACDEKGFARLRELRHLYVLTLSGPWSGEPIGTEQGRFVFKTALSDAVVEEIARIKSLRGLHVWYGNLSVRQRALLERSLPKCRLYPNLNKI